MLQWNSKYLLDGTWRPKAAAVNKYLAYMSNAALKHNLTL